MIKKEPEEEVEQNLVAEEDWRMVVKVEHPSPLEMVEVYLKQEDGGMLPELSGMVEDA